MADTALISIKDLHFRYNEHEDILKSITFDVLQEEMLGIIGPNGGGKSTLLKLIVGLEKVSKGKITLHSKKIAYVAQTAKLNTTFPLTVEEYLKLSLDAPNGNLEWALEFVNMKAHAKALVRELSGGQKQRVQLAKALVQKPEVLILDEPTNGLDSDGQDQLLKLIGDVKRDYKAAVIIVDHNIGQVLKHADKVLCLNRTYHWHGHKELANRSMVESVYHCELEHLMIHEQLGAGPEVDHHECHKDHGAHKHNSHEQNKEEKE
ncbi:metal ABC transporter ATP-binding protein [Halobacteriovorax sp. GB3]|uniref:metal ABC transporter ATP-binding protein n=1 Tax=Halobacteriovorax sp. GB3 TaxID=2719615 RepID=UPI00235FF6AB|nr:metal ABC transporter ATP-binding protein [Halobacteriovorax sp. GB3]MDD0853246.1 metal ABC transporter ATP-binding protein [Halobacteriovorax sp. GB3]